MKRIYSIIVVLILLSTVLLTGCKDEVNQFSKPRQGDTIAEIIVRGYGTIYVKLFPEEAPKAVENFTTHAKEGYYDGVLFYRIIGNSILESGDPTGTGSGGESIWGEGFKDEFSPKLQPYHGALCMANTGPDTNESRFFIVQATQTYSDTLLDQIEQKYQVEFGDDVRKTYRKVGGAPWFYHLNTVFGQVYKGFDVMNEIAAVKKKDEEKGIPEEAVIIDSIKIKIYQFYMGKPMS